MRTFFRLNKDELQDEENCKDIHHRSDLLEVATDHIHEHICNHSKQDTVRNRIGSGMVMIQMKAGSDSEKSSNLIFVTDSIIIRPTRISAGAVAADGIERKSGEKKRATAKQPAITRAVSPERPPCATPAALST